MAMKVLALKNFADGTYAGHEGAVYDLPDVLALQLIAAGAAVAIEPETAMVAGSEETASLPKAKARSRKANK